MTSLRGIGELSAVGLLLEIGHINCFQSAKHLASYFGLHPVFKESGDKISGVRMSKQGRKRPRAILFNVAMSAVVHDDHIKSIYEKFQKNGMCKLSALGAVMHKICRIIYGMLTHKTKYNSEIDVKNQKKSFPKKGKRIQKNSKRRLQETDLNAPISGRKKRKLKKQATESQNEHVIKYGIKVPAQKEVIEEY